MKKFLLFSLVGLLCTYASSAQDFSNKGKEFYLCFPNHVPNSTANIATLSIYITSDGPSSGTITMANGAFTGTFSLTATNNFFQEVQITSAQAEILTPQSNMVTQKSIKVATASGQRAVVVYAQQWAGARSAATLILPSSVLGKKYYAMSFAQSGSSFDANHQAKSQFQVIAIKPATVVQVTPKLNGTAQTPFTITLPNAGDVYQYQPASTSVDITGTYIESLASGTGGCLPIAVFSGSSNLTMNTNICTGGTNSYDPLWQEMYPVSTWGKNFGFMPFQNYPAGVPYRVLASEDNTSVFFNGSQVATLNAGQIYPAAFSSTPPLLNAPTSITADKPIMVAEYAQKSNCAGNGINQSLGDPDMVILNPIEQNVRDITIFSSTKQAITNQWVNVLEKTIAISNFKISKNGGPLLAPVSSWLPFTALPGYSYLQESLVGVSTARLFSPDSSFNAIAYGFGQNESYAYSAGTNVKDLYQQISVTTQYGIETSPSVCSNSPFKFKISLPYEPLQLLWDLSNLPAGTLPNHNNVTQVPSPTCPTTTTAVCYDSTTFVNGKQIWWYSLPTFYSIPTIGTYPIVLTAQTSGSDGCGSEQEINFDLEVSNPPIADFTYTIPGCVAETVQFSDASVTVKPNYHWYWYFDDPGSAAANISNLQNPTHLFTTSGPHNVRFASITTPGCLSDTITKVINIPAQPTATISGAVTVCVNAANPQITFTATGGTPPYTFTYNIDGGASQTITTTGISPSASVSVPTNVAGYFTYSLTNVQNNPAALCTTPITTQAATVVVNPKPTAGASGVSGLCQYSPTVVIFTGGNGTAPYTFTYHINSGANQTITTTSGNAVSVSVPTGTAGTFIYTITNVTDGSPTACSNAVNSPITVTVYPLATAAITGTAEVCLNAPSPLITFTATNGVGPYTFLYTINGGPFQTIQTTSGNSVTLPVPTAIAGTYVYKVITVTESSPVSCSYNQPTTTTATIIVDPKPTASFTTAAPYCEARDVAFTPSFSVSSGSVVSWIWNYGDGTGSHTRTDGNPFTVSYATAGPKIVTFQTVSDKGCLSTVFTQTITINSRPEAGFISPEVCLLDPFAQFTDTSKVAGGTITGWQWNFGDANATPGNPNTATTQNPTHVYTAVGTYTAQLIVFSNAGCSDTLQQQLTISAGNPQANFIVLNAANLCSHDSVAIQNKSTIGSGNITKLEIYWDLLNQPAVFDLDNVPFFDRVYKHKYQTLTTDRNYTIRMRSYSGNTCFSTKDMQITVHAAPVAQLNVIPNVCLNNGTVQFNQGSETGGVAGSGAYSGPGVSPTGLFNPLTAGPGPHTITYTFTTAFGCTDSKSTYVVVKDGPIGNIAVSNPTCQNSPLTYSVIYGETVPFGNHAAQTIWHWGDGSPDETYQDDLPRTHIYTIAGPYTASVVLISISGCKSLPNTITFTVNPQPLPGFAFTNVACLPLAKIDFLNTTPNLSSWTYNWDFDYPGGATSTAVNPSYTYTTVGPHPVRLVALSATTGCTNSVIIPVNTIHPAPRASFAFNKPSICTNQDVTVIDQSTFADGTPASWTWNYGDGGTSSGQVQPPHIYTSDGTFNVTLNISNSFGCVDDTSMSFTVYPFPTVNAGPDQAVLEGGQSVLEGTATGNDLTYLWTPQMYLSSYTIPRPIVKPVADITYTLTVTARGGCAKSDDVFIKVLKLPTIPNTFTPNNDGVHDLWEIKYLFQYPDNRVQVFTRTGQLVFESHGYAKPWDGTKGGKPLPFDTYYYVIEPNSGRAALTGYVTIVK